VGPNLRAWAAAEIAANTRAGQALAAQIPANSRNFLPASADGNEPLNIMVQLGAGTIDKRTPSMSQGCFNGPDSYGHATYWQPVTDLHKVYPATFPARRFNQAQYDEKSMNCAPNWMYAAFCAWDGGRLPTQAEYNQAWGPSQYPWGTTRYPTVNVTDMDTTVNWGNAIPFYSGNPFQPRLWYHYPDYAGTGNAADQAGYIAAPGRFALDVTTLNVAGEKWMDLGANLMEESATTGAGNGSFCDFATTGAGETTDTTRCIYRNPETNVIEQYGVLRMASGMAGTQWHGGSWEGHTAFRLDHPTPFGRDSYNGFTLATQYGKAGFRCAYPD
jgi:hypothetical protein